MKQYFLKIEVKDKEKVDQALKKKGFKSTYTELSKWTVDYVFLKVSGRCIDEVIDILVDADVNFMTVN